MIQNNLFRDNQAVWFTSLGAMPGGGAHLSAVNATLLISHNEFNVPYTLADAAVALRIAGGLAPWDARRDVSGDGRVDLLDAVRIAVDAAGAAAP